jgi:hypothetical protein
LFSIFIYALPIKQQKYSNSCLFADDLSTYYSSKSLKFIGIKLNLYLRDLERWLNMWRLEMSPSKCSYIIFSKCTRSIVNLKLKLYDQELPRVKTIKFLGVTFDSSLTFNKHIQEVRSKCIQRMNIIKIISNRIWQLSQETLKQIYTSLIRSVIEYSTPIYYNISSTSYKKLKAIQNNCIRIIFKLPYDATTTTITETSNIQPLNQRFDGLNIGYFHKNLLNGNQLIKPMCIDFIKNFKSTISYPTLICKYRNEIFKCINVA